MMEGARTLCLFLLLNQLRFCPAGADQELSTAHEYSTSSQDPAGGSSTPAVEPRVTTNDYDASNRTDGPRADCLMDTEMGLIAVGSAGGLILCLLLTTLVLACQVCQLQRRAKMRRSSRSNMDLVSSAGYWGSDPAEVVGLVGPCDASVVLEEVAADGEAEGERRAEIRQAAETEEAGSRLSEEAAAAAVAAFGPGETPVQMQSSSTRDSCLEVPRDLEDMPLVV